MKRRAFIKALALSSAATALPTSLTAAPARRPTFLVLYGISLDISAKKLAAFLGPVLGAGLPISCSISVSSSNGETLAASDQIARLFRSYLGKYPGLIEVMCDIPNLSRQSVHAQARNAYFARKVLASALFNSDDDSLTSMPIQSLTSSEFDQPNPPQGVYSAGIQNVLIVPARSGEATRSELWDTKTLRVFGGVKSNIFNPLNLSNHLQSDSNRNLIYLSAKETFSTSKRVISNAAASLAKDLVQLEQDQKISNYKISDLRLRDGYFKYNRRIGIHLLEKPTQNRAEQQSLADLKADLENNGIVFSVGAVDTFDHVRTKHLGYWLATETVQRAPQEPATGLSQDLQPVALNCASREAPRALTSDANLEAGLAFVLDATNGHVQGLDACGYLHLPAVTPDFNARPGTPVLSKLENSNDLVLAIRASDVSNHAQRNTLMRELKTLQNDWGSKFVELRAFADPFIPQSPLISLYRHTLAYQPKIRSNPVEIDRHGERKLWQDAELAWSYFESFTDKTTGMCPATVKSGKSSREVLQYVTMWDLGSHINALIAAKELEFIDQSEFSNRVERILVNLAAASQSNSNLPNEWVRTNRANSGNENFDGCDVGRLLASLHNLTKSGFDRTLISRIVSGWKFEPTIENGILYSIKNGAFRSTLNSHCAHYTALAFREWGYDLVSPYEVMGNRSESDGQMALLEEASQIGPLGAEPLLLEALDFGLIKESAYLADVLFAAQLREFETTGQLVCVSEGPIDRAPWFTYQGLQLNAPDRTWVVDTAADDTILASADFQRRNRAISPKAVFLWAAEYQHDFSQRLLDHVRTNAKTEIGYASSLYTETGKPTQNYSDINTNGIILQAVAKMLNRPKKSRLTASTGNITGKI